MNSTNSSIAHTYTAEPSLAKDRVPANLIAEAPCESHLAAALKQTWRTPLTRSTIFLDSFVAAPGPIPPPPPPPASAQSGATVSPWAGKEYVGKKAVDTNVCA